MSNYQRLISYIYAYEGGIKGKNIGFAKLDTRGNQCRIMVSVRMIYIGGNPIGVYLLTGEKEVRIGTLFARNGAGEFRTVVNAQNVEGSGCGIDAFWGLTVHETDSSWRCYTTIWEDAVTHAAEVDLQKVSLPESPKEKEEGRLLISEEIEREIERETEGELRQETEGEMRPEEEQETEREFRQEAERETERELQPEAGAETERELQQEAESETERELQPETEREPWQEAEPELRSENEKEDLKTSIPGPKSSASEERAGELWQQLRSRYPKLLDFDYEDGCEILSVKPQDIGLLPRENWVLGSNSFLLHGYYYHRYLILVRLNRPGRAARYLLGVPGNYGNNEKYMASMFGFNEFVLSKNQPPRGGRFGYWYTEIKME